MSTAGVQYGIFHSAQSNASFRPEGGGVDVITMEGRHTTDRSSIDCRSDKEPMREHCKLVRWTNDQEYGD